MHADKIMPNPIHLYPFLESSCPLGIPIGAPAIGRTTSSQRGMEGFQMIRMHLCGGKRLGHVGMCWVLGAFATALMPLCPCILEPHFDAFGQRLLGASSLAGAQGLTTQCKQATPLALLAIGPRSPDRPLRFHEAPEK